MSKHTPGPWIDWTTLEWIHDPQRLLTNTADALLIAAAPDMLLVLNAARVVLKNRDQRPHEMALLDAIKIVVAKAEGHDG